MTEFDELIAFLAEEVEPVQEVEESCKATLNNYQAHDRGDHSGPLKMIAWDRA